MFARAFTSISPYAMRIAHIGQMGAVSIESSRRTSQVPILQLPIRDHLHHLFSQKARVVQA
jgi:hypothetical protein